MGDWIGYIDEWWRSECFDRREEVERLRRRLLRRRIRYVRGGEGGVMRSFSLVIWRELGSQCSVYGAVRSRGEFRW